MPASRASQPTTFAHLQTTPAGPSDGCTTAPHAANENHATVNGRETAAVSDAWLRMFMLERACEAQIAAQAGGAVLEAPAEAGEKTAAIAKAGLPLAGVAGAAAEPRPRGPELPRLMRREGAPTMTG